MPAKLPAQQTRAGWRGSERNWNQNPRRNPETTTNTREQKKLNTKQKSNKCLLTTTLNGTNTLPLPLQTSRTIPTHCSFSTFFAYELWIENWDCDFPFAVHLSLQLFFASRLRRWS